VAATIARERSKGRIQAEVDVYDDDEAARPLLSCDLLLDEDGKSAHCFRSPLAPGERQEKKFFCVFFESDRSQIRTLSHRRRTCSPPPPPLLYDRRRRTLTLSLSAPRDERDPTDARYRSRRRRPPSAPRAGWLRSTTSTAALARETRRRRRGKRGVSAQEGSRES